MTLKITDALEDFDLAETVELDCGKFDIEIRQAAIHNEQFRAAVGAKALNAKKKTLVVQKGTLTGSFEEDVRLFVEHVIVGWGERPLLDDDKQPVEATPDNLFSIFTGSKAGRVLFSKVQTAATDDQLFVITEEDLGNS